MLPTDRRPPTPLSEPRDENDYAFNSVDHLDNDSSSDHWQQVSDTLFPFLEMTTLVLLETSSSVHLYSHTSIISGG